MGRRVHQPRAVEAESRSEEDAPKHVRNTAEYEKAETDDDIRHPVPGGQEDVYAVATEVGNVLGEHRRVVVESVTGQNPSHVGPPGAFARRVRVAFAIGLLVVDAVRGDPED